MTLPTNINLPNSNDPYLRNLTYALSTYLQQSNFEGNGTYGTLTPADNYLFISGSTASGTATYTDTILFTQRSNNIVKIWFDITWSLHTGTGNVWINLPYTAQFVAQNPFVGLIEASNIAFTAGRTYLVGNLLPNTNTIEIRQCGSGVASIPLPLPAAGTLRGSIVYAGQKSS
jgi:hypothetical protein